MFRGSQVVGRMLGGLVTGKKLTGIGSAWATAFMKAVVIDRKVPLWLNSPMEDLIVEDGRVVGAVVVRDGVTLRIGARRGVMLAAGGFESNMEWRQKYHGISIKAKSVPELARKIGVDTEVLTETLERFNGFARAGVDGDFGRGNSAYDRYYGDPTVHPNNNLGPVEKGPFLAYKIVLGDLGTKGGVLTDEYARALREDGSVIEGLYAAGNNSASVMGNTYPGPGATIAPAVVFGLAGARHMAR
ncbi:FAD-binding protein [Actinomyces minihominis]|uniref:FAD-binding protein n=1 Tax=Actinomyces minihominis TaxID=2002838 RepID=UPI000C06BC1D|nr:FAD-binding protein [Actinomyces minihominis]